MGRIAHVRERVDGLAALGHSMEWGLGGQITIGRENLCAAARTRPGIFPSTTNAVLLHPFACGRDDAVALVLAEGNSKDEGSVVTAGATVAAFADELGEALISEADAVPVLRRAMLRAHDSVLDLGTEQVPPGLYGTVAGPRRDLQGLGVSVVAVLFTQARAYVAAIGDCSAWLLREGRIRRLNHTHTLAHDPSYRADVRQNPARADDFADYVVMKVIGLVPDLPTFDVTRLDLAPSDKIILGNESLPAHAELASSAGDRTALQLCEVLGTAVENEPVPTAVAVLVGAIEQRCR